MIAKTTTQVQITAPNIQRAQFHLVGTAPLVTARFSEKAINMIRAKHEAGSVAKKGVKREARDFGQDMRQAVHRSADGWPGVPAGAFRAATISACRLVGFKMTLAKLSLFVEADGFDVVDGIPLVRLHGIPTDDPEMNVMHVRNATGVADLRSRPMWRQWYIDLVIKFDADQFTVQDVTNLLARVGMQVGIGEGRPDSRESAGLGWGTFEIAKSSNA